MESKSSKLPRNVAWAALDTTKYQLTNWLDVPGLQLPSWATDNEIVHESERQSWDDSNATKAKRPAVVALARLTLPPILPPVFADVAKIKFDKAMSVYQHPKAKPHSEKIRMSLCKKKFLQVIRDHESDQSDDADADSDADAGSSSSDSSSSSETAAPGANALVAKLDKVFEDNLITYQQFSRLVPGTPGAKNKGKNKKGGKGKAGKKSSKSNSASLANTGGGTGLLASKNLMIELPTGYR
jgi:hypothetical protein